MGPDLVVPGHCPGWRATHQISTRLPASYAASNVGTTFVFNAESIL